MAKEKSVTLELTEEELKSLANYFQLGIDEFGNAGEVEHRVTDKLEKLLGKSIRDIWKK